MATSILEHRLHVRYDYYRIFHVWWDGWSPKLKKADMVSANGRTRALWVTAAVVGAGATALLLYALMGTSAPVSGRSSASEQESIVGGLEWPIAVEYEYTITEEGGETSVERHIFFARSWNEWTDVTVPDAVAFESVGNEAALPLTTKQERSDDVHVAMKQYSPDGVETHGHAEFAAVDGRASAQLVDQLEGELAEVWTEADEPRSPRAPNYMMNKGQVATVRSHPDVVDISALPVDRFITEQLSEELSVDRASLVAERYRLAGDVRFVVYSPGLDVPLWAHVDFAHGGSETLRVLGIPPMCNSTTCDLG